VSPTSLFFGVCRLPVSFMACVASKFVLWRVSPSSKFLWRVSPSSLFYGVCRLKIVFLACVAFKFVLITFVAFKLVFMACVAFKFASLACVGFKLVFFFFLRVPPFNNGFIGCRFLG